MSEILNRLWLTVWIIVSAAIGSYLGAYLKKKGENLATHEDIDNLQEQVRVVTSTTKEIESKISGELWAKQKHWELKRDALFEAARLLSDLQDTLATSYSAYNTSEQSTTANRVEAYKEFYKIVGKFQQSTTVVGLVCGNKLYRRILSFTGFTLELHTDIMGGMKSESFQSSMERWVLALNNIMSEMREELGLSNVSGQD